VDHAGRLLCASCIAKLTVVAAVERGSRWPGIRRVIGLGLAVAMAWTAFFIVGKVLLAIPSAVHEGTIWKKPGEAPP
jgi:hypothetical protein